MSWQKSLANGFSSVKELLEHLSLPTDLGSVDAEQLFATRIPRGFVDRMRPGDAEDPLLLQVLAQPQELNKVEGYSFDPLIEQQAIPVKGLLHKYHGRVLLTLTGACAVHCRYCFRRHFPYADNNPGRGEYKAVLDYIQQDESIEEVILSGGDPLSVSDKTLTELIAGLSAISHVKILRFHTRIPIVLPERINASLLAVLKACPLQKVMVLHCNHAQEINAEVVAACQQLAEAGCFLLNQSVLLKKINDSVEALTDLSRRLFAAGVLPYYLHLLDKVDGAEHYDMTEQEAYALYAQLQTRLPGYLVPRLVREEPQAKSKSIVGWASAQHSDS